MYLKVFVLYVYVTFRNVNYITVDSSNAHNLKTTGI